MKVYVLRTYYKSAEDTVGVFSSLEKAQRYCVDPDRRWTEDCNAPKDRPLYYYYEQGEGKLSERVFYEIEVLNVDNESDT